MHMTVQSNPRKLYQSGNAIVVSLPQTVLSEADMEQGDRVVLTAEEGEITAEAVQWQVETDE